MGQSRWGSSLASQLRASHNRSPMEHWWLADRAASPLARTMVVYLQFRPQGLSRSTYRFRRPGEAQVFSQNHIC